jgi:hypothetical protein
MFLGKLDLGQPIRMQRDFRITQGDGNPLGSSKRHKLYMYMT